MKKYVCLGCAFILLGCGQKGDLYKKTVESSQKMAIHGVALPFG
ncbi:MAG: lipoprotein [Gammaproteobacteria bacterium]|nr:lipoprotein [Gammaproteobacteria bacterium]